MHVQREVFPKRRPKYLKPDSAAYANYHQHSDGQGGFFFYRTMGLQVGGKLGLEPGLGKLLGK